MYICWSFIFLITALRSSRFNWFELIDKNRIRINVLGAICHSVHKSQLLAACRCWAMTSISWRLNSPLLYLSRRFLARETIAKPSLRPCRKYEFRGVTNIWICWPLTGTKRPVQLAAPIRTIYSLKFWPTEFARMSCCNAAYPRQFQTHQTKRNTNNHGKPANRQVNRQAGPCIGDSKINAMRLCRVDDVWMLTVSLRVGWGIHFPRVGIGTTFQSYPPQQWNSSTHYR